MNIIHTADWHLGQKLLNKSREKEHQHFLDWLLAQIQKENIELLIVAGDIFDTGNPPNYARKQYYNFIADLKKTSCTHVLIIGGNHDSIRLLETSKNILQFLNVYVVGGASQNKSDDIFEIKNHDGKIELVLCAIPFLRDRDLMTAMAGESALERENRIVEGIKNHYLAIKELILPYKKQNIPVVATGHLFAQGADVSDKEKEKDSAEKDIYIGNLGKIKAENFPSEFDYIALGHIHKQQIIDKNPFIRYSGSPIPLSFSEKNDQKVVLFLQTESGKIKVENIRSIEIPTYRKLHRMTGNLKDICTKIGNFKTDSKVSTWLEIILIPEDLEANYYDKIQEFAKKTEKDIEILKISLHKSYIPQKVEELLEQNFELEAKDAPLEVFKKKCERDGYSEEESKRLNETFKELFYDLEMKDFE
jgi:exonuclease SbcD